MIRLAILLLIAMIASPQTPSIPTTVQLSSSTTNVNSSTNGMLYIWTDRYGKQLSKISFYVASVAGSLEASDISVKLVTALPSSTLYANSVTYDDPSDTLTKNSHGMSNGATVTFTAATSLPAGIARSTIYYVCDVSTNTFKIATDNGCSSYITDFSGSSGVQYFWSTLQASATVTSTPSGAQWVEVTGFSITQSVGSVYGLLIENMNATPASNYFAVRYSNSQQRWSDENAGYNYGTGTALGGSPQWVTVVSGVPNTSSGGGAFVILEYSDASLSGSPISNIATSANKVYGSNEEGTRYTLPSTFTHNIDGVVMCTVKSGSPVGAIRARIYTGANASESLLATTNTVPISAMSATGMPCYNMYFSSTQNITGGTVLRVMLSDSGADSSSNYYAQRYVSFYDSDAARTLVGNLQAAVYNGTTWTYTNTAYIPFGLIYSSTPFTASVGTSTRVY